MFFVSFVVEMKIFLTGATGFIGSHVARTLVAAGNEVQALILPNDDTRRIADILSSLVMVRGDLLDTSFTFPSQSFDCCIHLAWYVEPGKYLDSPRNKQWVEASVRLARAMEDAGCRRFLAAGTCFEYATSDEPLRESSHTGPRTLYAQSKLELFNALQSLEMEIAWARFFYQYGPHEDPRRLVPVVINALLRGQEAKLVPGDRRRDYLHIEDVASAVAAVAQSKLTGAVNIGSGTPTTVAEISMKIGELIGKPELVKLGALPYSPTEPMHIVSDNAKLKSVGWKPRNSLDEGLRRTIDWWRARL
jgi:nucleoside-diphosphate-sugar epimerase